MRIIRTHEMDPNSLTDWDREQVYNGLDVCQTASIWSALEPQLDNQTRATYEFSKSLQGPVLDMRLRGCLVDMGRRDEVIDEFSELLNRLERDLDDIVLRGVGMSSFNWRSNPDLQSLFYDYLALPEILKQGRPTTDRAAREALEVYPSATQIVRHINLMTELGDKISVLRTEIDLDGRIRTSYNIAGTGTGRFSSSLSEFGTGGNLQNVEESLRSIFIADRRYKFAKFDAKSIQSYLVGALEWNLFSDPRYLDACESGDVHTAVARLMWPALGWTGDIGHDKHIAEQDFYRHYTHRFMCKKLGHGLNFDGQPPELAQQTRIDLDLVQKFQPKYFTAFPAHKLWHTWTAEQIRTTHQLTSITGRRRHFHGRADKKTTKQALAYCPQADESFIVNTAMLNIWRQNSATIMFQDHDAITFMYPETDEDRIIPILKSNLTIPIDLAHGRTLRIPYDCEVGWNKGKYDAVKNPDGLREYTGHDARSRRPKVPILDRIICR
jgi:DNA polymerase I-like protein with 3'-5' exonuclease and polymerase domains